MEDIQNYVVYIPSIIIIFMLYMTQEKLVNRWRNQIDMHREICDKFISNIEKADYKKLAYSEIILYLMAFVYYHEKIVGRDSLLGLRPAIVAIWLFIVRPITIFSIILFVILHLTHKISADYFPILHLIFSGIYYYISMKLDKQEDRYGRILLPENVIKKAKEISCEK